MADKLNWLNQHPIWFNYPQVSQVVSSNGLSLTTQQKLFAQRFPLAEDYLKAQWSSGNFKDCCTFCAYNTVPRVAVWWAYSCVVDLNKEILIVDKQSQSSSSQNYNKFVDVKEIQPPKGVDPETLALFNEQIAKVEKAQAQLKQCKELLMNSPARELSSFIDDTVSQTFTNLKNKGIDLEGMLDECFDLLAKAQQGKSADVDKEHILQRTEELHAKVDKINLDNAEFFNSVESEDDLEKIANLKAQCLDSVWAYIVSPNEDTAQKLLDLGNACKSQVEGLLALVAFWSYGSLTPNSNQVIKTPTSLMSSGLDGLIAKCAVYPDGIYKPAERFERYFNSAFAALINESTWEPYVERNTSPHKEFQKEVAQMLMSNSFKGQSSSQSQEQSNTAAAKPVASTAFTAAGLAPTSTGGAASGTTNTIDAPNTPEDHKSWDEIFAERKAAASTPEQAVSQANQATLASAEASTSSQLGQLAPEVQAQNQAAEQALQERMAAVRPDINRRFRG